jgi:hypothetical protein
MLTTNDYMTKTGLPKACPAKINFWSITNEVPRVVVVDRVGCALKLKLVKLKFLDSLQCPCLFSNVIMPWKVYWFQNATACQNKTTGHFSVESTSSKWLEVKRSKVKWSKLPFLSDQNFFQNCLWDRNYLFVWLFLTQQTQTRNPSQTRNAEAVLWSTLYKLDINKLENNICCLCLIT